mgnify:CR=1 FL=1
MIAKLLNAQLGALLLVMFGVGCPWQTGAQPQPAPRATYNFNPGWKLAVGDPTNAAVAEFDDSTWKPVTLPHAWNEDWSFKVASVDHPTGVAWYRKHLELPAADAGRKIFLDVDGAMAYASVWVNGRLAGGWPYGYSSWRVDLTPLVKFGAENTIAIRLENPDKSSRWYPGAGIYRNVWLVKTAPVRVAHWGTAVTTPKISDGMNFNRARQNMI